MARVPTYDGPQVQTRALQPVYQREVDVSSGLQALGRAAGQGADILDRQIQRNVQTEVDQTDAEITTGWLEWDAQNRRQFTGSRAGEYEAAAKDWWDKTAQDYGGRLSPMAKQALGSALARKRAAAMGAVLSRQAEEVERHSVSVYDAKQNTETEMGIDTGDVVGAADRIRKAAAAFGAARNWNTEQVQAEQQKRLAALHVNYITRLSSSGKPSDVERAQQYVEANKHEIPASAQIKIDEVLAKERLNVEAKAKAAANAGKPLSEQLAAGADMAPDLRERYLQEVRNNHAMVEQAKREREATASDQAWQMVGQGRRVPESVLSSMDGKGRVQLQDYLRERAKKAAEGTPVKTDWGLYVDLRERLAAGEKVDLRPYAGTRIAGAQLEQLLDIQTRVRDPKKAPEVASTEQQMGTYIAQMDLGGEKHAEKRGQFTAAAYDLFNEHLKRTGKEPTYEDRQKILDRLTTETVTKPGVLWDSKGKTFTLPRVTNDQQWQALKKGDRYLDPTGNVRIKQ